MKRGLAAVLLLGMALWTCAEEDHDVPAALEFHNAYQALVRADEARDGGRLAEAVDLYREAVSAYIRLARECPDWQPEVVQFRIVYCNNQVETLVNRLDKHRPVRRPPLRVLNVSTAEAPEEVLAAPPVHAGDLAVVVRVLLDENKVDEARALTLDALYADPDSVPFRLLMAAVQCRAGQYEDADTLLLSLLEEAPQNADALVLLATASAGLGRLGAAEQQLRSALDADPDSSEAHYNLARLLLTRTPPDIEEARRHYRESLRGGGAPDPDMEKRLEEP